ncbi:tetratricopeptide repeat protein [Sphaerospermopsis sp. LEGE 08334]|uniref:CHAT domain-containing protein n=1 Tax=Sphaerospermopsis sp. LEGE 08334 TaxID=1828651 RepID=UPI001881E76A|nr:CHAT domain-containing tetratricopeptide repeat protein [Sphaerospermopsis sp. LEGE 08334]MBE9058139.1 tetratricopeptide repeat protein [Sphaerospermopsis sp. LEGE 08334]
MSDYKIRLIALITFMLTVLQPAVNLPVLFQVSQVFAQTPAARKAEADRLFQQGIEQCNNSQFTAALQSFQEALIIYRQIKNRYGEARALGLQGEAYLKLGDKANAIASFKQALAIAKEINNQDLEKLAQERLQFAQTENDPRKAQADRLFKQGIEQYETSQFTAALQSWQQALIIYRQIKNRKGEGAVLGGLGIAYHALGDYTKAIEYYSSSLAIAREIKDRQGEGNALDNLGNAYYALGDYTKAIEYFSSSLAIFREIKNSRGEGAALGGLGNAYNALGEYTKAIEYHSSSLAIAREIKDRNGEGAALGGLGNAYNALGEYTKAIEYHTSSLAIAREIKDRNGEGAALGGLGNAYNALGEYTKAIEYHTSSLAIAREIKDRNGEGAALGGLGNAYNALGEYTKAIEYHTSSLAIAREIKDRNGEGQSLGNLGNAYDALGEYTKAIEYFSSSLAIFREIKLRRGEGTALGNLGNAYYSLGDYTKAIEYYSSSLAIAREIKHRRGEGQSLNNLGNAYYALGDYTKAIEYHTSSLAIAREIKDIQGEGRRLNNLGLAFYESGNLPQAETTLFTTIEVWESIRGKLGNNDSYKVSIFEEQARTYRLLQKVLIAQNKTNEALEISERGRARAFVELLTSRLSNTNTSQTSQPTVDKPTISLLQKIAKQQNATLVQYSIIPDDLKIDGKQQTKESELYIWVIKPTGEITFRKSDLKPLWQKENTTLAELVTNSRESIGVRSRGGIVASLDPNAAPVKGRFQRLHELLITPIADLLPKKETERVVFIPQSQLFLVPFPALQDEKGKYLIEKHTILTAPSIQVLDLTHKHKLRQTTKSQSSLIVGNPTMPKVILEPGKPAEQLTPLIWAEKEAKNIASMLNISALTGNKATKAAILEKMPQAGIIHFATHGLLDDNRGIGSAIAFAPSGKDDGLLTADEILNLKLNADLVVLSACDTGRGRITGDGVVGLSRSLISAGTASIIVSLWAVDDDSTSFLMTEFYKNREQKLDKATALRKAMLTTKAKYSSPYNWAAFTLIGESE